MFDSIVKPPELHGRSFEDSAALSPKLWSPRTYRTNYRSLSPEAKARAVARGEEELMQIASKMAETGRQELTLRDLVETVREPRHVNESSAERSMKLREVAMQKKNRDPKSGEKSRVRSVNNHEGFLLRMVLPDCVGSKKAAQMKKNKKEKTMKKKLEVDAATAAGNISKVSLKPDELSAKRRSSRNDNRVPSMSTRHGSAGCWHFFGQFFRCKTGHKKSKNRSR